MEFYNIPWNEDDRAQRLLNIFPKMGGQLNVSYINSIDHVVAWHAHKIQTDYWTVLKGSLKVGLADTDVRWEYLSDKNPRVLKINPGTYHGYKALEPGTILLYYLTHKYDSSDEYRAEVGDFGEDWGTVNK